MKNKQPSVKELKLPRIIYSFPTFKESFYALRKKYEYRSLTALLKESFFVEFEELLKKYDLTDFKYNVIFRQESIEIKPIRTIDEYTLKGLML